MGVTFKWHFFLGLSSRSPKIGTLVVSKLWMLISSLKKTYLERARAQSYSLKSDIFNGVLHAPIKDYLTFAQRGFVFRNEIPNLTLDPFFYHNASISCLNE
jgi:hypothetical protein